MNGPSARSASIRFFAKATFLAGWGTVALLVWIALAGRLCRAAGRSRSSASVSSSARNWDPVNDVYGALPLIYGTLVSSALALLIAHAAGRGHRHLPDGGLSAACKLQDFFKFTGRAARRHSQRHLRPLGHLSSSSRSPRPMGNWLNAHFGWFPLFSTPSSGPGFLPAVVRPGHHDSAHHRRAFRLRAQGDAAGPQGRRARPSAPRAGK